MTGQCTYTTQGNLVCGKDTNKTNDSYIQTQFRGGCQKKEHFENPKLVMNQLNSSFKSALAAHSGFKENYNNGTMKSVNAAIDINGTYGLPWAPV